MTTTLTATPITTSTAVVETRPLLRPALVAGVVAAAATTAIAAVARAAGLTDAELTAIRDGHLGEPGDPGPPAALSGREAVVARTAAALPGVLVKQGSVVFVNPRAAASARRPAL